ncbi:hypothetical protein D9V32_09045 [Mycetocola tolaasinivorans]|uniref:HTH luxR-type domain-containing protein n=1 Tax=Mycetocola tolaasinivorans TaxID=76635 RepID=A0A3L7A5L6_9MICO|nr:LuxR C-terminal-related transcriptional regulator [Mycetocola tolaasinivorans]RLP75609.1 hypothetical protein D9V32_09045 [Mycetocola tolaasinivorans]
MLLTRAALVPRLDRAGLVLIDAPPGSGKTTLVAQWSAAHPALSGVWFGASRTETRAQFWEGLHLLLTARQRISAPGSFSREGLIRWFGLLGEQCVVLRDAHRVTDPEILEDIVRILRACPNIRFIAYGNGLDALHQRAAGAGLEHEILRSTDLRLTRAETEGYFLLLGVPDPAALADEVDETLDGTFHRLRAAAATHGAEPALEGPPANDAETDSVFDRHLAVVRHELHSDVSYARFLALGLPDELPEGLIAAVIEGDAGVHGCIPDLLTIGVYGPDARPLASLNRVPLALGPQLRARLTAELREVFPVAHGQAARRIIRWKMRNGYPAEALMRAVAIDDLALASEVVWRNFGPLMSRHGSVVARSLRRIPLREIRRFPVLCLTLALVYNSSGLTRLRAVEYFGLALTGGRESLQTAALNERALLLAMQSSANRVIGRYGPALATARTADDIIRSLPLDAREALGLVIPVLGAHLAITLHACGHSAQALEMLGTAFIETSSEVPEDRAHVLALIAGISAFRGEYVRAKQALARLDEMGPLAVQNRVYLSTHEAAARAILALEAGHPEAAVELLAEYRDEVETSEHWPVIVEPLALAELFLGLRVAATIRLDTRLGDERQPPISPVQRARLVSLRADLELYGGNLARADWFAASLPLQDPATVLFRARRELAAGNDQRCSVLLTDLDFERMPPRSRALAHLLIAACTIHADDARLSLDALEAAVAILEEQQLALPLLHIPPARLDELEALAHTQGRILLAHTLAARRNGLPNPWESAPEQVNLTVRERLVLRHLAHGLSAAEIARALTVSLNTVKTQSRSVYRKLGVSSRNDAVARAARLGLIREPALSRTALQGADDI